MRRTLELARRFRALSCSPLAHSGAHLPTFAGRFAPAICWSGTSGVRHGLTMFRAFSSKASRGASDQGDGSEDKDPVMESFENILNGTLSAITVPEVWPILPVIAVSRKPLFPGFMTRVIIKNENLKELIKQKVRMRHPYVGVFLKKNQDDESDKIESLSELHAVGSFAQISVMGETVAGLELILVGERRIRLLEPVIDELEPSSETSRVNGRRARQEPRANESKETEEKSSKTEINEIILAKTENVITQPVEKSLELKANLQAIAHSMRDVMQYNTMFAQQVNLMLTSSSRSIDNPIFMCDMIGTLSSADSIDLQNLLEEESMEQRLKLALLLMEKEKTVAKLKHDINKDVEKKVHDQHRKYLLNEQLKAIKKELGIEKDDKQALQEKMEDRIKSSNVPEYALKVINEESTKLGYLDPHSSDFSVTRNYLDWLTNFPWGKTSEEQLDLEKAITVLNEDHYGMEDVKNRILEFIAIGILKEKVSGKILCFYGPPGVGKTSIAKSIARALNREYFRFSVGGMTDVAEIKGHRRTYVGAMPGKIIQCFKKVQTENPLILIDEVDKIGKAGFQGDPSSALLEVLDPEQNANFNDYFLDVPVDLSKVLFICTANVTDTIPDPLKDRMEMIEVSGYVAEEKVNIAKSYLVPQSRENSALKEDRLQITPEAVQALIKHYCRESGVRNLQKHIEKIFRKAAFKIAGKGEVDVPIVVDCKNLEEFVGRPKFVSDRLYDITPAGVVMGLAWTAMGGSALYIEAGIRQTLVVSKAENKTNAQESSAVCGSLETTGHLGEVMKESTYIAYTVAKAICRKRFPENTLLEKAHLHVHVPEGATPKDGPSAGCTITSALLSLAFDMPVRQNISMTGEITLTGRILPVGGIKEKIIAARRAGVNCIILPEENRKDFSDLPDFIREGVEVHFVSNYDQILEVAFPDLK